MKTAPIYDYPTLVAALEASKGMTTGGYTFLDRDSKEQFMSFDALRTEAMNRAAHFRKAGLGKGDRLAIVLPDGEDFVPTFLGAVWAGIAYGTGHEIGWIAWGVGALVGVFVRVGAGNDAGGLSGLIAVVIALASIVGGKYAAVHMLVNNEAAKFEAQMNAELAKPLSDDDAVVNIADQLVDSAEKDGKTLKWPKGKDADSDREAITDYPADIAKDAKARWTEGMNGMRQVLADIKVILRRESLFYLQDMLKLCHLAHQFVHNIEAVREADFINKGSSERANTLFTQKFTDSVETKFLFYMLRVKHSG